VDALELSQEKEKLACFAAFSNRAGTADFTDQLLYGQLGQIRNARCQMLRSLFKRGEGWKIVFGFETEGCRSTNFDRVIGLFSCR
jgi:hypothetical protein